MTELRRYNMLGSMIYQEDTGTYVKATDFDIFRLACEARIADLEADLAAAIAQVGQREQVIHVQSVEIERLTAKIRGMVEES